MGSRPTPPYELVITTPGGGSISQGCATEADVATARARLAPLLGDGCTWEVRRADPPAD